MGYARTENCALSQVRFCNQMVPDCGKTGGFQSFGDFGIVDHGINFLAVMGMGLCSSAQAERKQGLVSMKLLRK